MQSSLPMLLLDRTALSGWSLPGVTQKSTIAPLRTSHFFYTSLPPMQLSMELYRRQPVLFTSTVLLRRTVWSGPGRSDEGLLSRVPQIEKDLAEALHERSS